MANEYRLTWTGIEALVSYSGSLRLSWTGVEVLHSGAPNAPIRFSQIGVEVMRSTTISVPSGQPAFFYTGEGNTSLAAAAIDYGPLMLGGASGASASKTEAQMAITQSVVGGVYANLNLQVTANGVTAASTVRVRRNAVDVNQTISVPSSTTGWFEDISNIDGAAATDTVDYKVTAGATGTSLAYRAVSCAFRPDTSVSAFFGPPSTAASPTEHYTATQNTSVYASPLVTATDSMATSTTGLANTEGRLGAAAGKLTNFRVTVLNNPYTSAVTATTMKDAGVNTTALTLSIPGSTTGTFEDATHSHVFAAETGLIVKFALPAQVTVASNFRVQAMQWLFTSDDGHHDLTYVINGGDSSTSTIYYPLFGAGSATETSAQSKAPFDLICSKMRVRASVLTGTATYRSRINGAYGNQTVSVTGTGWFEDASNTDTVGHGDLMAFEISGGTSRTIVSIGATILESARRDDGTDVMVIGV
jgi:hypothetical protein